MIKDPDFEIVRRIQSEDPDVWEPAFEQLHERYAKRVFNIAYKVLGDHAEAADATQEAFVIVFKHAKSFSFESRFFTWLYRVVVNLAFDRRKKRAQAPIEWNRLAGHSNSDESTEDSFQDPNSGLETIVEQEHAKVRVNSAMERLSPKLKTIVHLRYIEGLSYVEIGESLECSLGTVKSRLSRAHAILVETLGDEWADRRERGDLSGLSREALESSADPEDESRAPRARGGKSPEGGVPGSEGAQETHGSEGAGSA